MFFLRNTHQDSTVKKVAMRKGFSLVEVLIGIAVFTVISLAAYQAYVGIFKLSRLSQVKIAAINLANEQFEIIRNLPYSDVGVVGSIPSGKIPYTQNLVRSGISFVVTATIRNVDLPFDGTLGGTPNDTAPADNKLIEVSIDCPACTGFSPLTFSSRVAPKNLENASTNGALFVRVFDANGVPVSGASVNVVNSSGTSTITINDVTDNNGMLQLVDVPPGIEAYQITVTKSGYSSDRTYLTGAGGNPNPSKPHATVVAQQVTQISFVIDKISSIEVASVTSTCTPVSNVGYTITGSKLIGTGPDVAKYSHTFTTDSSGEDTLSNIEWDSYTFGLSDVTYQLIGLNPLNALAVNPDSTQSMMLVVAPKNEKALLVSVKDAVTQLPVSDAQVQITDAGLDVTKTTGRGFMTQTDWSGGAGQVDAVDFTKYASGDGNIEDANPLGEIRLKDLFGAYQTSGYLESSTFDTGGPSSFRQLVWSPSDQPVSTGAQSAVFQIATLATTTATSTWNFTGPDGAVDSYYTSSNSTISALHEGNQFLRYRAYLTTASTSYTPNIADVSFTFTSSCTPPGQVIFSGLSAGTYTISVGRTGYATSTVDVTLSSGTSWLEQSIILTPQ